MLHWMELHAFLALYLRSRARVSTLALRVSVCERRDPAIVPTFFELRKGLVEDCGVFRRGLIVCDVGGCGLRDCAWEGGGASRQGHEEVRR